jgi:hypothetical protein
MARMVVTSPEYVKSKYKLHMLKEVRCTPAPHLRATADSSQIEDMVAEAVEVNTPFNNPITGFCAFTHKAGIHAKAILNNPSTYEILNPADFGLTRYVHFASRLTGWNAVKTRVGQLGLSMTDDQVKEVYVDPIFPELGSKLTPSLVPPRSRLWPTYGRLPSMMRTRLSVASILPFMSNPARPRRSRWRTGSKSFRMLWELDEESVHLLLGHIIRSWLVFGKRRYLVEKVCALCTRYGTEKLCTIEIKANRGSSPGSV